MFSLTSCGSSLLNLTTELPRAPGPGPASLPHFGQAGSRLGAPPRWGEARCEALPYPHRGNYPDWAGQGAPLELISFCGRDMKGFGMFWDAHVVMDVLWHHPGSAGEGCGGLYCCLPPLSCKSVGSLFLLTLVTPNCAGWIPLERGPWRVLGRLGKELGIQQHLLPRTWDREEASRAHWVRGLGGQQFLFHSHLWGKQDAIWK